MRVASSAADHGRPWRLEAVETVVADAGAAVSGLSDAASSTSMLSSYSDAESSGAGERFMVNGNVLWELLKAQESDLPDFDGIRI